MKSLANSLPALTLLILPWIAFADTDRLRRFEVRDSVELSYFGTPANSQPDDLDDDGIVSPDGRYVLKLTHRGVLPQGTIQGSMWLFDATALKESIADKRRTVPKPTLLASMAATENGSFAFNFLEISNTIAQPRWSPDSASVIFRGRDAQENWQLFRATIRTQKVEALTPRDQNVIDFDGTGGLTVYLAAADAHPEQKWWAAGQNLPDVTLGTGQSFWHLLFPNVNDDAYSFPIELELWQIGRDRPAPVIDATSHTVVRIAAKYRSTAIALSPDSSQIATIAYTTLPGGDIHRSDMPELDKRREYRIVDLASGKSDFPFDTPITPTKPGQFVRYRAAWSPSGKTIAFTATDVFSKEEKARGKPADSCTVAILDIEQTIPQCVTIPGDVKRGFLYGLEWMPSEKEIRARYRTSESIDYSDVVIRREGSAWRVSSPFAIPANLRLELSVHETLNDPPVLVAKDPVSKRSRIVYDPNPQLANISRGTVTSYQWKGPDDKPILGGLVKPPNFSSRKRYPLVIQTHGFDSRRFYTYGYSETVGAGLPLASHDMVVLQVDEGEPPSEDDFRRGTGYGTKVYLAAIDQLSREGVIDPAKVGVSGYSFSGFLVSKAITTAPDKFAAAVLSNSDPGTMGTYYNYLDYSTPEYIQFTGRLFGGGKPYGPDGLRGWINDAPGFSTDKIRTPVLVLPSTPQDLISLWPLYAALKDQGKPVDLLYTRTGSHNLRKPLEILAHQQMLVDWFDFWLNGHEDPDSLKSSQYERWRSLKQLPAIPEQR